MRMLAANSDVAQAFDCAWDFLIPTKRFLYEYGLMLNDKFKYKLALLASLSGSTDAYKNLNNDIINIISPEAADLMPTQSMLDAKSAALMKQLENTIITFDRESLVQAQRQSQSEKMRI